MERRWTKPTRPFVPSRKEPQGLAEPPVPAPSSAQGHSGNDCSSLCKALGLEEGLTEIPFQVSSKDISLMGFREHARFDALKARKIRSKREEVNIYGQSVSKAKEELKRERTLEKEKGPANSVYGGAKKRKGTGKLEAMKKLEIERGRTAVFKEEISLDVVDEKGVKHKMRGTDRQIGDHSAYYAMKIGMDGKVVMHPVTKWTVFENHSTAYRLNEEEAEEAYRKRDKIFNHYNLMVQKRMKGDPAKEAEPDHVLDDSTPNKPKEIEYMSSESSDEEEVVAEKENENDNDSGPEFAYGMESQEMLEEGPPKSLNPKKSPKKKPAAKKPKVTLIIKGGRVVQ